MIPTLLLYIPIPGPLPPTPLLFKFMRDLASSPPISLSSLTRTCLVVSVAAPSKSSCIVLSFSSSETSTPRCTSLTSDVKYVLSDFNLPTSTSSHLDRVVTHLFQDDSSWPLGSSRFYLGLLPPLLPPTVSHESLSARCQRDTQQEQLIAQFKPYLTAYLDYLLHI